jgi:ribonuclease T2
MIARLSRRLAMLALVAAVVGLAATAAIAQRSYDRGGRSANHVAGVFDHYVLSLSWSPTHCAEVDPRQRDPQCGPRPPRPYAFVLHGLWPQYERGWPENCQTQFRPFVPDGVIDRMLDIMPSRKLVIHQYRKHGTCSGLEPGPFFDLSRRVFETVRMPERFVNPGAPFTIGREEVVDAFLAVNPKLTRDMIAVSCGGTGNRLKEVHICFSRDGKPADCGARNEQRRLCRADRLYVPPVREGGFTDPAPAPAAPATPPRAQPAPGAPTPLPPGLMPEPTPQRRI